MNEIVQWLTWLFGQQPPGALWIGGHADLWHGQTFAGEQAIESAAEYARWLETASAGTQGGVYFRLTPMRASARDGGRGRGKAADSTHLVAFGADLDLAGVGHKDTKLPRPQSHEQLVEILKGAGLPEPSAWVHSGGGRYAFWRLAEPLSLNNPHALSCATTASAALHARIIAEAAGLGFKIDNTRDLARVYRLPGTLNRKGAEPFCAHVLSTDGPLYTLAQIETAVDPRESALPRVTEQRERIEVPASGETSAPRSSLFGDAPSARASVSYTVADAMRFVAPALQRLRSAGDGEINNRLNDAAMALAHFGPEFWSRDAAEKQLLAALEATVYDGATWQAGATVESAYAATAARGAAGDAECWRGVLIEAWSATPSPVASADAVDALLAEMLSARQVAEQPPPRPIVAGLLQFDSESWLIGEPGSKKSFVALDLAGHIATGQSWQGRRVEQATVVMIIAEGAGGTGPRITAWEARYGAIGERMHILPRPVQARDSVAWAVLAQACWRLGAGLIVLDTQARVTVGLEENSATDMGVFIDAVRMMREATGACVLTVHHTGRHGGDARGSSAIDGAQTTELKVTADGFTDKGWARGRLIVEKQKDIEACVPLDLRFERVGTGQGVDGEPVTSLVLLPYDVWRPAEMNDEALDEMRIDRVPETPGDWTKRFFDGQRKETHRRILAVMAVCCGQVGRTEPQIQAVVRHIWHDGQMLGKKKPGQLDPETWSRAWVSVQEWRGANDEPVVHCPGGERWALHPDIRVS